MHKQHTLKTIKNCNNHQMLHQQNHTLNFNFFCLMHKQHTIKRKRKCNNHTMLYQQTDSKVHVEPFPLHNPYFVTKTRIYISIFFFNTQTTHFQENKEIQQIWQYCINNSTSSTFSWN